MQITVKESAMTTLPPEPVLSCYLEVLRQATIRARALAWSKGSHEQIADLMDAVHVIPELLNNWGRCDEEGLMGFLKAYDNRWAHSPDDFSLVRVFESTYRSKVFPRTIGK